MAAANSDPGSFQRRFAPDAAPIVASANRTFTFVFSDESVDRYGDVISARGWQLANYKKNPVVLFGHDAGTVANVVGKAKNIRVEGSRLIGDIEFMGAETNLNAESVFQMVKGGFLKTGSVGFQPIEWELARDKTRPQGAINFKKQELLEFSIVPVPANANALVQAKAAGIAIERLGFSTRAPAGGAVHTKDQSPMLARSTPIPSAAASTVEERRRKAEALAIAHGSDGQFKSGPEFLRALLRHELHGETDSRLTRAPSGGYEADPTAGGFLAPTIVADDVELSIYNEADVLPYVRRVETDKPTNWRFPAVAETSRADGSRSGGALAYWAAEGVSPTATWPHTRAVEMAASKLIAVAPVTNELLQDAPMLYDFLVRVLGGEMAFQIDRAIIKGTGAGQPLGVLNGGATISVAKDTGQPAGTLTATNIGNVWSRLAAPCRKRALWFCCEDAEGQFETFNSASTAALYVPQGVGGNPYPLLKGRPLLYSEAANALGAPGDLVLFDPSQYLLVDGGFRSALSLDVSFTSDQAYFRMTWRGNGAPLWPAPITPANGTATRSPYVVLAQR